MLMSTYYDLYMYMSCVDSLIFSGPHRWSGLDEKGVKRGPDETVLKVGKIKKRRKEKRERRTFVYGTMKNKH